MKSSCKQNARSILKDSVSDPKERSKMLYEILNNVDIKQALTEGKLDEAEELAMKLIEKRRQQK